MNCNKKTSTSFSLYHSLNKVLITVFLTLLLLIALKSNDNFKEKFYKKVYSDNFSFAQVNHLYQSYFGNPLPFAKMFNSQSKMVFNEQLKYDQVSDYKQGAKLKVSNNYLVPIKESGMVVFIGQKEDYGNTVIIQQMDGIDVWYGNVNNLNVSLYDYVEKGSLLGETSGDFLYLIYKKEGKILDYKKYI
ncbi:MAG: M23 family metallopeptidase [Bacilli bacterium]